ncbi:M1 family metallopeptidase [Chitinophagaceae bacterium LWZ2-11]
MKQLLLLTLCAGLGAASTKAQSLYMPRDVKAAFAKGTRSADGKPGKNYWQNTGRYDISVTAMPPNRIVKGVETIVYINNSPDTLKSVAMKLFLNIHKPGAPRQSPARKDYLSTGVEIDAYAVNGQMLKAPSNPNIFTGLPLRMPKPILPHDSVKISLDWHYQISLESGREGMIDSTTFFLAYFYPRVAVYDDYNGWDRMTFTDSQEFYSDFNDYNVTVTVPKNYIVWGTGTLLNANEVLQPEYAKRLQDSYTTDQQIHIATKAELDGKNVTAQNATNTWKFKASNIPDMAFGLSDHFVWDASSVVVDKATGRRASSQAAYNDTAKDYHSMTGIINHSLDWLSNNWPGIPYPYEKMTVFHGYAGMEYPMMANDETYGNDIEFATFVAAHEIAHTYMPFYMGINETRYGFMDEGWATTFEWLISAADLGKAKADTNYMNFRVRGWINDKSSTEDLPIITPGDVLSGAGLGNNEYGKASLGYLAMKDLLGDDLFKKCLHEYMDRWHGKHPIPWDFFNTFNAASGKNLNWFWNAWYFTNSYIDLGIEKVTPTSKGYTVALVNTGGMPAPFDVVVKFTDGTTDRIHQTSNVWQKNIQSASINIETKKKVESLKIDGSIFMDANLADNSYSVAGK